MCRHQESGWNIFRAKNVFDISHKTLKVVNCKKGACFVSYLPFKFHLYKYFPTDPKHLQTKLEEEEKNNRNDMSVLYKRRMNTAEGYFIVVAAEVTGMLEPMNFSNRTNLVCTHTQTLHSFQCAQIFREKETIRWHESHSFRTSTHSIRSRTWIAYIRNDNSISLCWILFDEFLFIFSCAVFRCVLFLFFSIRFFSLPVRRLHLLLPLCRSIRCAFSLVRAYTWRLFLSLLHLFVWNVSHSDSGVLGAVQFNTLYVLSLLHLLQKCKTQ